MKRSIAVIAFLTYAAAWGQPVPSGGSPTGPAGGVLSGSYPNPCSAMLTCGAGVPTANCTPGTTPDYLNTATATRYYCSATNVWTVGQSVVGQFGLFNSVYTNLMSVLQNGNVGIGTTNPGQALQVGSTAGNYFQLNTSNGTLSESYSSEANPRFIWSSNLIGTGLGGIGFNTNGTHTLATYGAAIGEPDIQKLAFYTTNGTVLTERVRITETGSVGIGTTVPNAGTKLEVVGIIQTDAQTTDPGCTATTDIGKFWFDNTTNTTAAKKCVNVAGTLTWVAF